MRRKATVYWSTFVFVYYVTVGKKNRCFYPCLVVENDGIAHMHTVLLSVSHSVHIQTQTACFDCVYL